MSYHLTIRFDEEHSRSHPRADLARFMAALPHIVPNGPGYALDDPPRRWMEIYPEFAIFDDDTRDYDDDPERTDFNCVNVHIPYGRLGEQPEHDYFPTVFAIAEHLGWPVYDGQQDALLRPGDGPA